MVKAVGWRPVTTWVLEGTYLEVQPNAAGGWFITDVRTNKALSQALRLGDAKRVAVNLLDRKPGLWRNDGD